MSLDCRLSHTYDGFSHSILIGVVEGVRLAEGEAHESLIWQGRRYHKPLEFVELVRRPADIFLSADDMLF